MTTCINGCAARVKSRGMCNACYQFWRRRADPALLNPRKRRVAAGPKPKPLGDRFRVFVGPATAAGCREWRGNMLSSGYGAFYIDRDHTHARAHRVAWTLERGPIPDGMAVCHSCDNPKCVSVGHLFLGTHDDNMGDMVSKGRYDVHLPDTRGELHASAKINAEQVVAIRARADAGENHRLIAEDLGISRDIVWGVAARRTWRHVPEAPAA